MPHCRCTKCPLYAHCTSSWESNFLNKPLFWGVLTDYLSGNHLSQTEVECIFWVLYAGPPETTLHPNQGSRNVQSTGALNLHSRLRQCIFSLHWTLPVQCCTAGTLKLYWTCTPFRYGLTWLTRVDRADRAVDRNGFRKSLAHSIKLYMCLPGPLQCHDVIQLSYQLILSHLVQCFCSGSILKSKRLVIGSKWLIRILLSPTQRRPIATCSKRD